MQICQLKVLFWKEWERHRKGAVKSERTKDRLGCFWRDEKQSPELPVETQRGRQCRRNFGLAFFNKYFPLVVQSPSLFESLSTIVLSFGIQKVCVHEKAKFFYMVKIRIALCCMMNSLTLSQLTDFLIFVKCWPVNKFNYLGFFLFFLLINKNYQKF